MIGACMVACGIYVTMKYLNSIDTPNTVYQSVGPSSGLAVSIVKGDLEIQLQNITMEDRLMQPNRKSLTHPDSIEWPNLLDRPIDSYPVFNSLLDIVTAWNPDNPDPPPIFRETLQHFNYSNPVERAMAETFRDSEIPFKVYDVPEVDEVTSKWTDGLVDVFTYITAIKIY
jgi:hypothetical protein